MPDVPQAHRDERRRQILRAAHACFGREGIHGTSVQDICEEADVSVGTIYRYFEGKADLVRGLAEWARLDKEKMVAGLEDEPPLAAVQSLARRLLAPLGSRSGREAARLDVRLWAEALTSEELEAIWRENYEALHREVSDLVEAGQEAGEIRRDVPAAEAARVFLALGQGAIMLQSLELGLESGPFLDTLTATLVRGLAAGEEG